MSDVKRLLAQVEFERRMVDEHQPCDSCWMLVELYDRLPDYEAAAGRVRPALSLARSMILSGEPMSENANRVFEEAFAALARLREGVPA